MRACWPTLFAALSATLASRAAAAPVIVGTYYEEYVEKVCASTATCGMPFSAAPTGKRVLTRYIDCSIEALSNQISFLSLYVGPGARRHLMGVSVVGATSVGTVYGTHYETTVLFGDNKPLVYYEGFPEQSSAFVRMYCTLTGELQNK